LGIRREWPSEWSIDRRSLSLRHRDTAHQPDLLAALGILDRLLRHRKHRRIGFAGWMR
jgi:hypothetical protein